VVVDHKSLFTQVTVDEVFSYS